MFELALLVTLNFFEMLMKLFLLGVLLYCLVFCFLRQLPLSEAISGVMALRGCLSHPSRYSPHFFK